jgi:galactose mutarotase-like enzyme
MVCCSLQRRGQEVLGLRAGLSGYADRGSTMGIPLLFPWANRLSGTSYEAAGARVEFPADLTVLHLEEHGLPIHGALARFLPFEVTELMADEAGAHVAGCFESTRSPELGRIFPFPHRLQVEARLAGGRLEISTTLAATGDVPVPVSFGYHPYLRIPGTPRGRWQIDAPVVTRLAADERGIPTGERVRDPVAAGPLGDRTFDDGYAEIADGTAFTVAGEGLSITVTFERGYGYAQLFAPPTADVVCFEPMTAPANALVSGDGLTVLQPGEEYAARVAIEVQ